MLVSTTTRAVIPVGILNDNALITAFTAPLDFKLLYLLEDMLLQFYHLLFFYLEHLSFRK